MAATLTATIVDGAPGNIVSIAGSGLSGGVNAKVTLDSQGVTAQPGLTPSSITLNATFASDGSSVSFPVPDGVMSGTLTVTADDLTTATCAFRANSQYVQASEYIGEGEDTSDLAAGELDVILRRASSAIDTFIGGTVRKLQVLERHKYRPNFKEVPRVFPWRTAGDRCPIVSVDQLTFVAASDLVTVFDVNDMYVNDSLNYIEILAYAIGNYALLGELEVIGYSANVIELALTSGFTVAQYPQGLRDATIMTATAFLNRRRRQKIGMGAFSKTDVSKASVDPNAVRVPDDAKRMLMPYVAMIMG